MNLARRGLELCASVVRALERGGARREDAVTALPGLGAVVCLCRDALQNALEPALAAPLRASKGFQSWMLVTHEVLSLVQREVEQSARHGTLELLEQGPRLRVALGRLENQLSALVARVRPLLLELRALALGASSCSGSSGSTAALAGDAAEGQIARRLRSAVLVDARDVIEDAEGLSWWCSAVGAGTYAVKWEQMVAALCRDADDVVRGVASQPGFAALLLRGCSTAGAKPRQAVTALEWGSFLFSHGPGVRVALLQLRAAAQSAPWFAGALTYDEARHLLAPHRDRAGTFLVRFSESASCTWAVSYCNAATGLVNHALVSAYSHKPPAGAGAGAADYFSSGASRYDSLEDLVAQNAGKLRFPCPGVKSLGPARFFRDFLTYDEAEEMLRGRPVGTFLLRFSARSQGCLVVAWVCSKDASVLQSRIYCDPSRGFELGDQCYARIPDLVRANKETLRYPLEVPVSGLRSALELSREELERVDETLIEKRATQMRLAEDTNHQNHHYGSLAQFQLAPAAETAYLPLGGSEAAAPAAGLPAAAGLAAWPPAQTQGYAAMAAPAHGPAASLATAYGILQPQLSQDASAYGALSPVAPPGPQAAAYGQVPAPGRTPGSR
jgi:hypothetical protein